MPFGMNPSPEPVFNANLNNNANNTDKKKAGLSEIATSLDKINILMDDAKKQLANHLLQGQAQPSVAPLDTAAIENAIQPVIARLDAMGQILAQHKSESASSAAGTPVDSAAVASAVVPEVKAMFDSQNGSLQQAFGALDKKIEDAVNYVVAHVNAAPAPVASVVQPVAQPVAQPAPVIETPKPVVQPASQVNPFAPPQPKPAGDGLSRNQLMKMILGSELCANSALAVYRDELLDGFLRGNKASAGLIGIMIEFHASTPDKMPMMLKDIGEAYYRWHPKRTPGSTVFERALSAYVCKACDAVGIKNSIELVETGQRFDNSRHNSVSRGVEIVEVKGWVVLRDNGKVYTRAAVEVQ